MYIKLLKLWNARKNSGKFSIFETHDYVRHSTKEKTKKNNFINSLKFARIFWQFETSASDILSFSLMKDYLAAVAGVLINFCVHYTEALRERRKEDSHRTTCASVGWLRVLVTSQRRRSHSLTKFFFVLDRVFVRKPCVKFFRDICHSVKVID